MSGKRTFDCFAVTAPGLEGIAAAELGQLGIAARAEAGGASWSGEIETLWMANLHLRTASRVLARVANFRARSFIELERHVKRIDWTYFVPPGAAIALRVGSRKSRLYHEGAIEERFARIIGDQLGVPVVSVSSDEAEPPGSAPAAQLFVIRFHRDECTVSADSSGALLHRRGYRQAVGKAPLRETLAAGMLLASGWVGNAPLLDTFCGSGTIPIEGALLARNIAPGLATADRDVRRYAFDRWPAFDPAPWERLVTAAQGRIRASSPVTLQGSDRDPGAIEAATANAARTGVEKDIAFRIHSLSSIEPPATAGWLVTNPPYGIRIGERAPLRDLYAAFGKVARQRLSGWMIAMLIADPLVERQMGIRFREVLRTRNGGISVRLVVSP